MFKTRLINYLGFLALTFTSFFVVIVISIAFTGEREKGLAIGLVIGGLSLFLINIFCTYFLLNTSILQKLFIGIIIATTCVGLSYFAIYYEVKIKSDLVGIWTPLVIYCLSSIVCWEMAQAILSKSNGR